MLPVSVSKFNVLPCEFARVDNNLLLVLNCCHKKVQGLSVLDNGHLMKNSPLTPLMC